jgi:ABC-type Co2+ transport system permease subunit
MDFSMGEFINRALKYLLEGLAVAVAAIYIPKKALALNEVAALALTAAAVFALLDVLAPSVGVTARQGAGFGLGANLVGFPMRR